MTLYLLVINAVSFLIMCADKYFARRHLRRIPERTLFLSALLGGSPGAMAAMVLVRHKTRHRSFVLGMPAIFLLQCLVYFLFFRG